MHEADADKVDATGVKTPVIRREYDATEINRIINDASVLPQIGTVDHVDVSEAIADTRNVLIMTEGGGIIFIHDEPGVYEVHTNFLPDYRGKYAIDASLLAYRWMFTHTDCMVLQTKIPAFNRPAALSAKIVGFENQFRRVKAWPKRDGTTCDLTYYALPYERWLWACDEVVKSGQEFHRRLDEEYARLGQKPHSHIDEQCHDRAVGAAMEMAYGGQPEKAVILYNRWARFANYGTIALVSKSPLVIDIGEAILLLSDATFKVIKCRLAQQ